jgi:hypothetical protein
MARPLAFPKPDRYAKRERIDYSKSAIPKDVAAPDASFRAYARQCGCQVHNHNRAAHPRCSPVRSSGYSPGRPVIVFAHTPAPGKKGMSKKAPDLGYGIGLCHDLHMEQERIGWESFQRKYKIDAPAIARSLADSYASRNVSKGVRENK